MNQPIRIFCLLLVLHCVAPAVFSQITLSGNVYDSSKLYAVPGVEVINTSGSTAVSDSVGAYHIEVAPSDSISFFYQGKSTIKFPVKTIQNYNAFDISLRVKVKEKYKLLSPVTVFSRSYQQDSIQNRQDYAKVFGSEKPGIRPSIDPGGAAGMDLDALIGVFQFRKNKQNLAFKQRLVEQEQDQYVDYRFSSKTITRITGLTGDSLETYERLYRPEYLFVVNSTLAEFYSYILNTSYAFRRRTPSSNGIFQ